MKTTALKTSVCLLFIIVAGIAHSGAQQCQWMRQSNGDFMSYDLASVTDAAGNTYVTGSFASPHLTFGGITLNNTNDTSINIFLVKYDPAGNVLWAHSFGGAVADFVYSITMDTYGYIYLYGNYYSPAVTFGSYALPILSAQGNFLVKLNAAGTVVWARAEQQKVNGTYPMAKALIVRSDHAGGVVVSGSYIDTVIIGGNTVANVLGFEGIYLARYDTAGNVTWAKSAAGGLVGTISAMATDNAGNIFIGGRNVGPSIYFDTIGLTNQGGTDKFLARFNAVGTAQWARDIADSGDAAIEDIGADGAGNAYITGVFNQPTITLGAVTLTNAASTFGRNIFIAQYSSTGNVNWARSAGGNGWDMVASIQVDALGASVIGGSTNSSSALFGSITLANAGSYLAKYNASSGVEWVKGGAGANSGIVSSVTRDGAGYLHAVGYFRGAMTIDTCTVTDTSTMEYSEVFVAKYGDPTESVPIVKQANSIVLYPNPASTQLTVRSDDQPISEITITNLLGQQVANYSYHANAVQADVADLPPGIYLMRINGTSVRKFVKN